MKRIKAAVVGIGFIGMVHVEQLRRIPCVEVVAIADSFGAKEKAELLGVPHGFKDFREMMDTCRPDCVHVCTPNSMHMEVVMAAIERGINIVCEKPMARDAQEAQKMVDALRESKLVGALNFHNRFYPIPYHMRRMVQNGDLGEVYHVQGGYLQDWLQYQTDFSWKLLSSQCGKTRATADIGSHWIDLSEYVTHQKVREVFAEFKTVYPKRIQMTESGPKEVEIDTEDFSCILLRFDGGAVGTATFSGVFSGKKNQTVLQVAGTRQSLEWDSEKVNDLLIGHRNEPNGLLTKDPSLVDKDTASIVGYPGGHSEGFPDAFKQNFIAIYNAIQGKEIVNPFATFEDGLHIMKICDALYESAHCSSWISID